MRITVKGQVTIPLEVREALGLLPHTEVDFVVIGKEARLRKAKPRQRSRGAAIVEQLRGAGGAATLSTDQIMALTRGGS
jgi:AbrB family looped-hinge helix DNA binding protein